jgi:hypothetical protein
MTTARVATELAARRWRDERRTESALALTLIGAVAAATSAAPMTLSSALAALALMLSSSEFAARAAAAAAAATAATAFDPARRSVNVAATASIIAPACELRAAGSSALLAMAAMKTRVSDAMRR